MSSKIYYKSVKEDQDYILINVTRGLDILLVNEEYCFSEKEVYEEFESIYFGLFSFGKEHRGATHGPIALRKDSIAGNFILSHPEIFVDDDTNITYKKVVDAYSTAVFEDNSKMANKILPLFRGRISGTRNELSDMCNSNVLDYILENGNFEKFLNELDGNLANESREYIVFEDGEYSKRSLGEENVKVKSSVNN